jgi:UDP-N-acetylglucosamine 4,6-dehydratase/5-epimerase
MKTKKIPVRIQNRLKNKIVLISGGAGSIGVELVKRILECPIKQIRVVDINEHALFQLKRSINDKRLRILLGNIQDKDRMEMAGNNVDIILHLAAIKNIEITEFNPIETIDTNVNGIVNFIKMTMKTEPEIFLNISTDKAVESSTLYGATKLLAEKLTTWAGIHLNPPTKFATVRLGNIMETRGNVFEVWKEEVKNKKPISITHPEMKRYFFHIEEAVDFILKCIPLAIKGEIFIPKMKSYKLKDLASKISKNQKIIGLRKDEKMEEFLFTKEEELRLQEKDTMWVINPN